MPRNLLIIVPSLRGGGAERVAMTLVRHIPRVEFKITLAIVDGRNAVYRNDVPIDVEVIDFQSTRARFAVLKIWWLIWQRRPDVVFTTMGHLNLAVAALRPLLPRGTRHIARETGNVVHANQTRAWPRLWAWGCRHGYARIDAVVCQSAHMRDELINDFGVPAARLVVISNPVDIARIQQLARVPLPANSVDTVMTDATQPPIQLVAAGSLVDVKGFDLLIDAIALCPNPKPQLTILGDGPLRAALVARAQDQGVAAQVQFLGFQPNPYLFFAQADWFVLSSRADALPNVVLEALACGTPVVSTPAIGGVIELLKPIPGCVVCDSTSTASLAAALQRLTKSDRIPAEALAPYAVENIAAQYVRVLTDS